MARRALAALFIEAVVVCGCTVAYVAAAGTRVPADPPGSADAAVAEASGDALLGDLAARTGDPTPTASPAPTADPTPAWTPDPSPTSTRTSAATPTATPEPSAGPADLLPVTNFAPVPTCQDGSQRMLLMASDQYSLMLIDKTYAVPKDYVPPDLVNVRAAGFGGSYKVRAVMIGDLKAMRVDAANAGAALAIFSAYRSYQEQIWSFGHWMNALGPAALLSSARPGHSEHQLGLAIDFKAYGGPVPWAYRDFARETAAGAWLAKNAWKYGFVESYPWNKVSQVCYAYEPWHYRYVGRGVAAAIHASKQTPRVWLWQHQPDQLWREGTSTSPAPSPVPAPSPAPSSVPTPAPTAVMPGFDPARFQRL